MGNVWFLPGFVGSELGSAAGGADLTWLNYTRLALGGGRRLGLAADGVAPLPPDGEQQFVGGLVDRYYGPAFRELGRQLAGLGLVVRPGPYDWRLRTRTQGELLAASIRTSSTSSAPASIVAHSHGGLVARSAWASLVASGDQAKVRRIVTLGSPHYGTWRVGQVWSGSDDAVQQLVILSAARVAGLGYSSVVVWGPAYSAAEVVRITETWPALYEVAPSLAGPDAAADPLRAAFYGALNWPADKRPSQTYLDYARDEWAAFIASAASLPPSWVLTTVAGDGVPTPAKLLAVNQLGTLAGIGLSSAGDGTVTVGSALLPDSAQLTVQCQHADLPWRLAVSGQLAELVTAVRVAPAPPPPPVFDRARLVPILGGPPIPTMAPFVDP